jgi:hypothetical protein
MKRIKNDLFPYRLNSAQSGFGWFGGREELVDVVPVDHIPPGGEVFRAAVLEFEVVGVFPDVEAEEGSLVLQEGRILVGG